MKFHKLSYIFFISLTFAGLISCDDDNDNDLTLSVQTVSVLPEGHTSVEIIGGRAPYAVISDNEEVATARIDNYLVDISAKQQGKAVLTIRDKSNTVVTLTVDVETRISSFEIIAYKYAIEATDATIIAIVEEELTKNLPVPEGGRYELEFFKADRGNLKVYTSQVVNGFMTVTFQFIHQESNTNIVLRYDNKEFIYQLQAANESQLRSSPAIANLYFIELMTENYQTLYPDAGITVVVRGQLLKLL